MSGFKLLRPCAVDATARLTPTQNSPSRCSNRDNATCNGPIVWHRQGVEGANETPRVPHPCRGAVAARSRDQRQGAKASPGEYQAASRGSPDASVLRIMAAEPATPVRTNRAIMAGRIVFMFVSVSAFTCLVELARLDALSSACWGKSARAPGRLVATCHVCAQSLGTHESLADRVALTTSASRTMFSGSNTRCRKRTGGSHSIVP
jgi:hypothetical protein